MTVNARTEEFQQLELFGKYGAHKLSPKLASFLGNNPKDTVSRFGSGCGAAELFVVRPLRSLLIYALYPYIFSASRTFVVYPRLPPPRKLLFNTNLRHQGRGGEVV